MNTQLELIPTVKHIPQWLAEHFNNANTGNYRDKQLFYAEIKYPVLEKYAEKCGWDKQIIERKCHSCSGTGVYKHYNYEFGQRYLIGEEKCWNCSKGIYSKNTFYLKRYILNGVLYHIPQFNNPHEPIINTINGIISHREIAPENALKSFLVLSAVYNRQLLRDLAIMYTKKKYQTSFIQQLLSINPRYEDLPF